MSILSFWGRKPKHDIQITLSDLPPAERAYVEHVIKHATNNDVRVILTTDRYVHYMGGEGDDKVDRCNGYVDDEDRELACACGQPLEKWFRILVHETCHMDQLIEEDPLWFTAGKINGVDTADLMELWLDHKIELNNEQARNVIASSRDLELDCERRVLRKIEKFGLPLNKFEYARAANSYIYFYNLIAVSRRWYSIDHEPYNIPELVERMPHHLDGDYTHTPAAIFAAYVQHMPEYFKQFGVK